ncbi:MAG: DUF2058 domain-containing protein [Desulfobacterales bacterium]|nr:DUF2058 domain-containing protein [Desulfobacterales bacterium]
MGNSFQDQLLKAGLVDKKQVNKAKQEKRRKKKKNKGKTIAPKINKTQQEQLAREQKNREENKRIAREKQEKEARDQVRQWVKENRMDRKGGDSPYYFAQEKRVKKIYVDGPMAKKLSSGALAIVEMDDAFEVVPAHIAKQIQNRDPKTFVMRHEPEGPGNPKD